MKNNTPSDCCDEGKEHLVWLKADSATPFKDGWWLGLGEGHDWYWTNVTYCPFCGAKLDGEPLSIDVEHHEYECGGPCTPNGCVGHDGPPIAFCYRGVWFEVAGYRGGEVPWDGPGGVKDLKEYKEVFDAMTERLSR